MSIYQSLKPIGSSKKTAFNRKNPVSLRQPLQALLLLPLFVVASCGGGGDGGTTTTNTSTEFTKSAELIASSADIMKEGFDRLNISVVALNTSVKAYCTSPVDTTKRTAAQAAFKTAMSDLQHSMQHQLGPALDNDAMLKLYSWPTSSTCGIDQDLAKNDTALNVAVNKRGIDALEYLLFVAPATGHSCPAGAEPVAELAAFNALSENDREASRCAFMLPLAADVAVSAQALVTAWGTHVDTMKATTNVKTTLNEITDAMYFLREDLRGFKLDRPLGGEMTQTQPSCGVIGSGICQADLESPHARVTKENIRTNVLAFKQLYFGGDGGAASVGFDDWLREVGKADVADRMSAEIEIVLTKLNAINGSLFDAISSGGDINAVNALLAAVDVVSETLRIDMLPALGLNVPAGLASDTD